MKNFYEMSLLLEATSAFVERFPQDFEQVLNFMAGGPWNFVNDEFSPFISMNNDKSTGVWVFHVRTEYRGMSESGRHYKISVRLNSTPKEPINRDGFERMQKWRQEFVSYDPKGSPEDVQRLQNGKLPSVYFQLEEIRELGPDTDGRPDVSTDADDENLTPEQQNIRTMIGKLKKIQDDLNKQHPKPKWTPERLVYIGVDAKHVRPVDLARQVKEEIGRHEKENPNFK